MAGTVSHKLTSSFEGALAGGGDPATSPLYVFGPFLKLIVVGAVAGVAGVTFGPTVWLVVFTIAMVSGMYRLVMRWVTDGSGGSGLSEEEFGPWAVKINAGITIMEYTLTFLVSMAAMVTFIADRFPVLNETVLGIPELGRVAIALVLSVFTGWLVNRGPRVAARSFGPATLGVLLLLWAMVLSTLYRHLTGQPGFETFGVLPPFDLQAFSLSETAPGEPSYFHFTLGGYVRILAVMTGIEVFANLVAAYDGAPEVKARMAFGSLLIIMGTAAATMLVVGPAIFALSDPSNEHVSVFTQTMDQLLPQPLAYAGTLVGIAVLLSASAASAQGLQNLALGLTARRYVPSFIGRVNNFGVASAPVWIEVTVCCLCFVLFGTDEETYLAIYAAGVFILLSMTGWAASKRLIRFMRRHVTASDALTFGGALGSAVLTSVATVMIFYERFSEGAWTYLVGLPMLYLGFTYVRRKLGPPSPIAERLAEIEEAALGGFGPGQQKPAPAGAALVEAEVRRVDWPAVPAPGASWRAEPRPLANLLVPLDGSKFAETSLPLAARLVEPVSGRLTLVSVVTGATQEGAGPTGVLGDVSEKRRAYLVSVSEEFVDQGVPVSVRVLGGSVVDSLRAAGAEIDADAVVMSSHGRSGIGGFLLGHHTRDLVLRGHRPVIVVRPRDGVVPDRPVAKLVVALDGSRFAERLLPYVRWMAQAYDARVELVTVPEVPLAEEFGALVDIVAGLRAEAVSGATGYLERVAAALHDDGVDVRTSVLDTVPARSIIDAFGAEEHTLGMLATHGRGGLTGTLLGSVAGRVIRHASQPVFVLPIHERHPGEAPDRPEGQASD